MQSWGALRLVSILFAALILYFTLFSGLFELSYGAYLLFLTTNFILFSHYIMSFVATRKMAWRLLKTPRGLVFIGGLTLLAAASNWYEVELGYIYFGIHFALSETYSRFLFDGERQFYTSDDPDIRNFRLLHLVFMTSLYFFGTSHTLDYLSQLRLLSDSLPPNFFIVAFVASSLGYFSYLVIRSAKIFPGRDRFSIVVSYVAPEFGLMGLAAICHFLRIHWTVFVAYHIIFWLVAPALARRHRDFKWWIRYFGPTFMIMATTLILYPSPNSGTPLFMPNYFSVTGDVPFLGYDKSIFSSDVMTAVRFSLAFGNFHILLSLALSALNPRVVRRATSLDGRDPLVAVPAFS